jgi:hypothetical protein
LDFQRIRFERRWRCQKNVTFSCLVPLEQESVKNNKGTQVLNHNSNSVGLQCKKNTGDVVSISGDEDFLFIAYHPMFSSVINNLDFVRGSADLNDLDMFLESTLESYKIGQITMPELELFQCLAFGIVLKYATCSAPEQYAKFIDELEHAYQDICKISTWIKSLFSDCEGEMVTSIFTVASNGSVTLKYKKTDVAGHHSYADLPISAAKFDFKVFAEFCSMTHCPLMKMELHSAKAIHNLICENVRFCLLYTSDAADDM